MLAMQPDVDWARGCPAVVDGSADVEALVRWAVRDQAAVEAVGGRIGPDGYLSFGRMVERVAAYGAMVQWGSGGGWDRDPHPLAVEVMGYVGSDDVGVMVASHAMMATRPDWMPDAVPKWEPRAWNGKGQPKVEYTDDGKRPWYVLIRINPHPDLISGRRAAWLEWWDRLDSVADGVSKATGVQVRNPAIPRYPWATVVEGLTSGEKLDIPS